MSQVVRLAILTKEPDNVFKLAQRDTTDLMEFVININVLVRPQLFSLMIQQVCASKYVPQALMVILQRENVFLNAQSHRILMETR